MATIEGIYLAGDKENLIFEYPTSSNSPGLKTIFSSIKGIDSVQDESIIEISPIYTVYRVKSNRVFLYALVRSPNKDDESLKLQTLKNDDDDSDHFGNGNEEHETFDDDEKDKEEHPKRSSSCKETDHRIVNPNSIFVFLNTINQILTDYFGSPLNSLKIEANYDIMCNLMQELIEGGYPYITDVNTLKELVPFQNSLGSKLLSTTNQLAKSYVNGSNSHASLKNLSNSDSNSSQIPWRRSNVKYTNNELFVDLKEEINVVLSHPKNHKLNSKSTRSRYRPSNILVPTVAVIKGQIDFTSHLSGVPDVQLSLNLNGHDLGIPSFHRCIRTESWIHGGNLSFIPPDGKTTIMNYTVDLDQYPTSKIQRNLGLVQIDYKEGLGLKKNEFEITLNLNLYKNVSKISGLKVFIKTNEDYNLKTLRLSHGDLQTRSSGNFEWKFDQQTPLGINPVLRGIIEPYDESSNKLQKKPRDDDDEDEDDDKENETRVSFPDSVALSYSNTGFIPSGIRVGSLKIVRGLGDVKPYKGVKYITRTGDFVIR